MLAKLITIKSILREADESQSDESKNVPLAPLLRLTSYFNPSYNRYLLPHTAL
jgi:hypothetical protein